MIGIRPLIGVAALLFCATPALAGLDFTDTVTVATATVDTVAGTEGIVGTNLDEGLAQPAPGGL